MVISKHYSDVTRISVTDPNQFRLRNIAARSASAVEHAGRPPSRRTQFHAEKRGITNVSIYDLLSWTVSWSCF